MEYAVAAVSIIGLVVVVIVQAILMHKERVEMAKIDKVKDISELEYVFAAPDPVVDEEIELVNIADMPDLKSSE